MFNHKSSFQLHEHPWLAMILELVVGIAVLVLVIVGANLVGVPENAPYRPLITPTPVSYTHLTLPTN